MAVHGAAAAPFAWQAPPWQMYPAAQSKSPAQVVAQTPPAVFLRLLIRAVAEELVPVPLRAKGTMPFLELNYHRYLSSRKGIAFPQL